MFEFNRLAHFTGVEEFCHTHYFITKTSDTVVFLVDDHDVAARAAEIVPVIQELFDAQIIWIQAQPFAEVLLPSDSLSSIEVVNLPAAGEPVQRFLDFVLALQWLTYFIGRVGAVDINTFHAGYNTERLVAGTLRTIRRSAIRVSAPNKQTNEKDEPH
jgi:hypothetical protein